MVKRGTPLFVPGRVKFPRRLGLLGTVLGSITSAVVGALCWDFYKSEEQGEGKSAARMLFTGNTEKKQVLRAAGRLVEAILPPHSGELLVRDRFLVCYNNRTRNPDYVVEVLTSRSGRFGEEDEESSDSDSNSPNNPRGKQHRAKVDRSKFKFLEDQEVHPFFRSKSSEFNSCGYDRGHLISVADIALTQSVSAPPTDANPSTSPATPSTPASPPSSSPLSPLPPSPPLSTTSSPSDDSIAETFLMTNISPQLPEFNRGYWKLTEEFVRSLVEEGGPKLFWEGKRKRKADTPAMFGEMAVITGPLFLSHKLPDGTSQTTYRMIGKDGDIAVPTHFFKVIGGVKQADMGTFNPPIHVCCLIIPHIAIPANVPLSRFVVPLDHLQKKSGLLLFEKASLTEMQLPER